MAHYHSLLKLQTNFAYYKKMHETGCIICVSDTYTYIL